MALPSGIRAPAPSTRRAAEVTPVRHTESENALRRHMAPLKERQASPERSTTTFPCEPNEPLEAQTGSGEGQGNRVTKPKLIESKCPVRDLTIYPANYCVLFDCISAKHKHSRESERSLSDSSQARHRAQARPHKSPSAAGVGIAQRSSFVSIPDDPRT